jgi:uncharacterized membrane protein
MTRIRTSIDVARTPDVVYDCWIDFESFPTFMEGVEEVRRLDGALLEWVDSVEGHRRSWRARIVDERPDRRVAWEGIEGVTAASSVTLVPVDEACTRVLLEIEFDPRADTADDELGVIGRRAEGDLVRFKELLEAQAEPDR